MQFYELDAVIKGVDQAKRAGWEQARMISITSARAMGAKIDSKMLKFPWEKEVIDDEEDVADVVPDAQNVRELKAMMKMINNKKNE